MPNNGSTLLDNNEVNQNNLSAYKSIVSYVPQEFYIGDSTVKESIFLDLQILNQKINFALKYSVLMSSLKIYQINSTPY